MDPPPPENVLRLVAHRGDTGRNPENTLPAFVAAVEAGATLIELDVHLSADAVPVVIHDADLRRTASRAGLVAELPLATLLEVNLVGGARIPTLASFVEELSGWPHVTAFVELKPAAIAAHGAAATDHTLEVLRPVLDRCVLISFDHDAVVAARSRGAVVGWILDAWDDATRARADDLASEYLFCDRAKLPGAAEPWWPGPWRWIIYDVDDIDDARDLAGRGAYAVETMIFAALRAAETTAERADA
ncbi:MAG: glycerophosphodiester phosphodiesterase [Planctomycetes bacterium]|nr:glycerophosphodiester phosphodiesterase [Planctomycetota bacterium]